jgi:hypothetical protein
MASCVIHRDEPDKPAQQHDPLVEEPSWARPNEHETPPIEPLFIEVPRNILIIGDSEACAVGAVVHEFTHHTLKCSCSSGTTIQDWAGMKVNRVLRDVDDVDVVIVFLGGNNIINENVVGVQTIIDKIGTRDCVWVGNAALFGKTWNVNQLMKDSVGTQCSYLDSEKLQLKLPDKMHPDRASARLWLQAAIDLVPKVYKEVLK